jgi:flagellar basal-body rod modification protein FlgD
MDSSQMAAQLAQFSSVEQLQQINETLAGQGTSQSGLQQLLAENGALASVGKNVVVSAAAVDTTNGAPTSLQADIPSGATSATLHVYDAKGTEVATQALGAPTTGRQTFALQGSAAAVKGGVYTYAVTTTNSSGTETASNTYVAGRVDGVRYTTQGPVLTIGGVAVPYMAVTEITP